MYTKNQLERRVEMDTVFRDFTNRLIYPPQMPPVIGAAWTADKDTQIIYNCIEARMAHENVCVRNVRHHGYFTYDARPVWQEYAQKIAQSVCLLDCHGETVELCITVREHAVYGDADDMQDVEGEPSEIDRMQDYIHGNVLTLPRVPASNYSVFVQNFSGRKVAMHGGIVLAEAQVVNVNKLCAGTGDSDYLDEQRMIACRNADGDVFLMVLVL